MTAPHSTGLLQSALHACMTGDLEQGERLLRSFLRQVPHSADGWFNLGKVLNDLGKPEESVQAYRTAADLQPDDADVLFNLGNVLRRLKRNAEALHVYQKAVALDPHHPGAQTNLGLVLEEAGNRQAALLCYQRAAQDTPAFGPAHANLGLALLKENRLEEAEQSCRRAISCDPDVADMYYNLAGVLLEQDRYNEADEVFRKALRLRPAFPEAWVNRGIGYLLTERPNDARDACLQAIALRPDLAEAHVNLAVALLQTGAYAEGWREYEWRFQTPDGKNPRQYSNIPEWDGCPIAGKTVLVYQEQGLGDILQCMRFAPLLARKGARVVIACQRVLHPLLKSVPVIADILAPGEARDDVDFVCPVFSLPRLFAVTPATIPVDVPYLDVSPGMVERWRKTVSCDGSTLNVGLAWTGNPAHSNNRRRSLPDNVVQELLAAGHVQFHSLHAGMECGDSLHRLQRYDERLQDFAEVAALMRALDLVITVDTSFAHLAGGLGVPVWLLLNFGADWRWMLARHDSPWYPTMKIFRQQRPGEWAGVLTAVLRELQMLAQENPGMNTIELLRKGLDEHHAGRLEAAAKMYAAALEVEPDNVSALRCLGVLRSQQGDLQAALVLLQAAARFAPDMPEVFNDLGSALRQKGALDEAILAFDEAIRLQPVFAEAYFNRGVTFEALAQPDRAMESYDLALQANPLRIEARYNRAAMFVRSAEYALAVPDLVEFVRALPDALDAGLLLGRAYRELGRWGDAEKTYARLADRHAQNSEVFVLLGTCRLVLQKFEAAADSCIHALALDPDHAEAHFKAGVAYLHLWNLQAAMHHLARASALRPDSADTVLQLGVASQRAGLFAAADAAFQRALSLDPENADVHWHYAEFLLLIGDYRTGWEEFEWRWLHERFVSKKWEFAQSNWNGEDIQGKTILLHPEQGFGDTLQFVRYVPMVASLGARVLLGTPPELARLLADFPGTEGVYLSPALVPQFDVHCPLLSLPHVFKTDIETIPSDVPYLHVNPSIAAPWTAYFADYKSTCKVGLIWSGNPGQEHNRHRACRLSDLHPLFGHRNVTFFSLQKGPPASELHAADGGVPVIDLSPQLVDFADTAAVMQHLDLVISTDTGPVHLAGGLGRPTWLLLSAFPDWRWMIGREDSPWYPHMHLFRQTRTGEWRDVVERVSHELAAFVAAHRVPGITGGEA